MTSQQAIDVFNALASDVRLPLFRLLVRHAPEGLVAGEIAAHLGQTHTNLSFHLKELVHVGLITREKEGRCVRYRADIPLMLETVAYLTDQCCAGHPELCRRFRAASPVPQGVLPDLPGVNGQG
ncbi:ArsR/SmtB family transcription factor [Desulfovibrio legallii]|jgi:DNA-binding transcriptional ArsR family regulator|uniref:DNA-binding transcriptional regulator, ArsR family n=1 Tax=Desulfovibrio legallii TaxID=571438 RepID=A0A1G7MN32_9BACT|nr:metalloregulator ArsR/SmtB family transcription factor [Desulfovibrio legallii]SDF63036.1 DNA-binding transcriptional regulator, ArsR family [Desulfovibrio legallii]